VLTKQKEDDKQRVRKLRTEERQRRDKARREHRVTSRKEEVYVEFHSAIEAAIAQAELGDLAVISQAAKGGHLLEKRVIVDTKTGVETTVEKRSRPDWKASAFRLERRAPKRWSQVRRMELSGTEGGSPIPLTLADSVKLAYQRDQEQRANGNGANGHGMNGTSPSGAPNGAGMNGASED
jgi:hypothetical protein